MSARRWGVTLPEGKPVIRLDERLRESPRVPCPKCGKAVHPDVMRCPHCRVHYAEPAGDLNAEPSRPLWMSRRFLTIVAALLAAGWIFSEFGYLLLAFTDFVP